LILHTAESFGQEKTNTIKKSLKHTISDI